jgi:hypothetical protein
MFGEWNNSQEQKIVVFRGVQPGSSCWVVTREGQPRQGASVSGMKEEEITVYKGEKVYAIAAYIRFKTGPE